MNKNIKLIINYLVGPLLFGLLAWSLYKQIMQQPDLGQRWRHIRTSWQDYRFWIVFMLMFINWGIEARKWQVLIRPLEKISLGRSYMAIFAGCSITMLTPNRIGEYGGRIVYISEPMRIRAISLTILGSISQLAITMLMGTIALFVLKNFPVAGHVNFGDLSWLLSDALFFTSLGITVILLLLFFRVHFIITAISQVKAFNKLMKHIKVIDIFSGKQLLRILFLSFFRYMVFILQYVLLLKVMDVNISFTICFLLLNTFYLVMVVAPTVGFTELPVRATASLLLFGLFSANTLGIQAAAFGIWLINLVLPAILGSLLIFGIKIMKER